MPSISEILKSVMVRFGKKEVSSDKPEQIEELKDQVVSMQRSEFDEKIRVEGVKSTVDRDRNIPDYKQLDPQISKKIDIFFKGITQQDFYKYKEETQNQGISTGGEPFKCYAELDGSGNIIVTPTKMIKIDSKDQDNGEYTETRMQEDGTLATVSLKKVHGDIVSANYSRYPNMPPEELKKYTKLIDHFSNPNIIQKLEMKDMSEEEKIIYTQELQKLGIENKKFRKPEDMTREEYEASKEKFNRTGKGRYESISMSSYKKDESFEIGNCMYDDQDKPLSLSYIASKGPQMGKFVSYRRTADGKYLDATSFHLENGKPVYDILEYEEVLKEINGFGIDTSKFAKMQHKVNDDLQNAFPKEAERISDKLSRDREQREDPNKPRNDSGR